MHDSALLLFELGAVILGLGLLGAVSVRFGFSPIPLYLLAGLALDKADWSPSPPATTSSPPAPRSASSCCCSPSTWNTPPAN